VHLLRIYISKLGGLYLQKINVRIFWAFMSQKIYWNSKHTHTHTHKERKKQTNL